jgi:hypothetical protein
MNKSKWIGFAVALVLIGGTAGLLFYLRHNQRLAPPGIKTHPIAGSIRLECELPEHVLNYRSEPIEVTKMVLDFLPPDTSFGQRGYTASNQFPIQVNIVLMGVDRTSLHKPQFCLNGFGWHIDDAASSVVKIPIDRPFAYDLPAMKLATYRDAPIEGQTVPLHGVYVYWFVSDTKITPSHNQRMWWTIGDLLRTGTMPRWAYVTCFATCNPGQEEAAFEQIKKFMAAAVPEFQLTPRAGGEALTVKK